jgi:SAM-dependent methyltransferase
MAYTSWLRAIRSLSSTDVPGSLEALPEHPVGPSKPGERHVDSGKGAGHLLFWSAYALVYDVIWDSPLTRRVADVVADALPNLSADGHGAVVDLGCGTGLISRRISERGFDVLGVDTSVAMLRRAERVGRTRRTLRADAARTAMSSGGMQAAVAVNLLHLHPDPGAVLAEAVRLVAPAGTVVLVWPTDEVTPTTLNRAELLLGRSRLQVAAADAGRMTIGLLGQAVRTHRHEHRVLRAAVRKAENAGTLKVCSEQVLFGCQHLLTLRVGSP